VRGTSGTGTLAHVPPLWKVGVLTGDRLAYVPVHVCHIRCHVNVFPLRWRGRARAGLLLPGEEMAVWSCFHVLLKGQSPAIAVGGRGSGRSNSGDGRDATVSV
jgi:hypothetical protein